MNLLRLSLMMTALLLLGACELYADLACDSDSDCPAGQSCGLSGRCLPARDDAGLVAGDAGGVDHADVDGGAADSATPADSAAPADGAAPTDSATPSDGSVSTDSAAPTDSATPSDGSVSTDSTVPADSATPSDGSVSTDSTVPTDSAVVVDSAPAADAAPPICVSDGVCDPVAGETQRNCGECRFIKVAVSSSLFPETTCGIRQDNSLWCWGENDYGSLAIGRSAAALDTDDRNQPTKVNEISAVMDVALGDIGCAVTTVGDVYCWGKNGDYELGLGNNVGPRTCQGSLGDKACADYPVQVDSLSNITSMAISSTVTCAVDGSQRAFCWGLNEWGAVGVATTDTCRFGNDCAHRPVRLGLTDVQKIRVGQDVGCAYHSPGLDDLLSCWGDNDLNQLAGATPSDTCGNASTPCARTPIQVRSAIGPITFDLTGQHGCYLDYDEVYCWGAGAYGALGIGSEPESVTPTLVHGLPTDFAVESLVTGSFGACVSGVNPQGTQPQTWCWGINDNGQLALGHIGPDMCEFNTACALSPQLMTLPEGVARFEQLALGNDHSCGIGDDGILYCWGSNGHGQLGTAEQTGVTHSTPQEVAF